MSELDQTIRANMGVGNSCQNTTPLQEITGRLKKLQTPKKNQEHNTATGSAAAAWQPAHAVLGVWLAQTHWDEIMRDIDLMWADTPEDIQKLAQNCWSFKALLARIAADMKQRPRSSPRGARTSPACMDTIGTPKAGDLKPRPVLGVCHGKL